jgi:beta-lactam-binding protein with PASTA domain
LQKDDGLCKNVVDLAFYTSGPARVAGCKKNEVDVPSVVGQTLTAAKKRLAGQPLRAAIIYRPARAGERVDVVVGQFPKRGTLSAFDKVTLVLPKSLHGTIPRLVGLPLVKAQTKLERLHVRVEVSGDSAGVVVAQRPRAGTAVGPGLRVHLMVSRSRTGG